MAPQFLRFYVDVLHEGETAKEENQEFLEKLLTYAQGSGLATFDSGGKAAVRIQQHTHADGGEGYCMTCRRAARRDLDPDEWLDIIG
jgi:hypothetical protein